MTTTTKTISIAFSEEEIREILAREARTILSLDGNPESIHFTIEERGGDPMDLYPGRPTLVSANVSFKRK